MTANQLKLKLSEIVSAQTLSECNMLCRELLEASIGYIYDKTEE